MADDLVKRLRGLQATLLEYEAADRIESQDRVIAALSQTIVDRNDEITELKRRLARWESAPVVAWQSRWAGKGGPYYWNSGNLYKENPKHLSADFEVRELIARHTEE